MNTHLPTQLEYFLIRQSRPFIVFLTLSSTLMSTFLQIYFHFHFNVHFSSDLLSHHYHTFHVPVPSQPCQMMDAGLKPAEALGGTEVQEISNVSQKLYSCDLCPKKYALVMRFNRHKKDHKTGKALVQKKDEIQRAKAHEGPLKSCKTCGQVNVVEAKFLEHERTCQGNQCFFCKKQFLSAKTLKSHVSSVHLDKRSFVCPYCGKRLSQSGALKIHILTHTGEKPFSCSICHKRFGDQSNLNTHLEVHEKKKELTCNICSFKTRHKSSLYTHTRKTHERSNLFKCEYCDKTFPGKCWLTQHI